MRVLVITSRYPPVSRGGHEVCCAQAVERISHEHEVLVVTAATGRKRASDRREVLRVLPHVSPTPLGSLAAPFAAIRAARTIRPILDSFQPDFVFVWNFDQIPHAAIRIAEHAGAVAAYSVGDMNFGMLHDHDQFLRHLRPGERGLRGLWARAMRLVNHHPALRLEVESKTPAAIVWYSEAMQRMHPLPQTVEPVLERVVHGALRDADLFRSTERILDPMPTIAYVGRVEWVKGPDIAYRALAILRDRYGITARLLLAGPVDKRMQRDLDRLGRELAIADHVEQLGSCSREQVAQLLSRSHALVVPSRWLEAFGLVCLEGALARAPVVAARSGGMPEMLREGQEALFFAIDDADACADALAQTLTDRAATTRRVERAVIRARAFSLERFQDGYAAFIDDAVEALSGKLEKTSSTSATADHE